MSISDTIVDENNDGSQLSLSNLHVKASLLINGVCSCVVYRSCLFFVRLIVYNHDIVRSYEDLYNT